MEKELSVQRKNIHDKIWKIADELRGSIDGWDFKSYILVMMFYRYLSDKYIKEVN